MRYIVELEPGAWLAPWPGDPGRTCVQANARQYKTAAAARAAITRARKMRMFTISTVVEVTA